MLWAFRVSGDRSRGAAASATATLTLLPALGELLRMLRPVDEGFAVASIGLPRANFLEASITTGTAPASP
jgi:hypothetical protein